MITILRLSYEIDPANGRDVPASHDTTIEEFLRDNDSDDESCKLVKSLSIGQKVRLTQGEWDWVELVEVPLAEVAANALRQSKESAERLAQAELRRAQSETKTLTDLFVTTWLRVNNPSFDGPMFNQMPVVTVDGMRFQAREKYDYDSRAYLKYLYLIVPCAHCEKEDCAQLIYTQFDRDPVDPGHVLSCLGAALERVATTTCKKCTQPDETGSQAETIDAQLAGVLRHLVREEIEAEREASS